MKVNVDYHKCTGLGICESVAPEVFEVDETGQLVVSSTTVPETLLDAVREAVLGCPTEALRLEP